MLRIEFKLKAQTSCIPHALHVSDPDALSRDAKRLAIGTLHN
jgi:hypothetical protein